MSDLSRGELGIQMLCAWNNIPRDKAPASWSEHHNEWTRDAWARVAEAAIRHHAANSDGGVEPEDSGWRNLALQFDNHRIDALSMLRYAAAHIEEYATVRDILRAPLANIKGFLAKHPLPGEAVLAARIEAMSHPPAKALDGIAVTDEMVERFGIAFYDAYWTGSAYDRAQVRAALTAALK